MNKKKTSLVLILLLLMISCAKEVRKPIVIRDCKELMPYDMVIDSAWQYDSIAYFYMRDTNDLPAWFLAEETFYLLYNRACFQLDAVDSVYLQISWSSSNTILSYSMSDLVKYSSLRIESKEFISLCSRNFRRKDFRLPLTSLEHMYGYYIADNPSDSIYYYENALGFLLQYSVNGQYKSMNPEWGANVLEDMIELVSFDTILQQDLKGFRKYPVTPASPAPPRQNP